MARSQGRRRSRLEMMIDILASTSQPPGKTITRLSSEQALSGATASHIIDLLLERGMLRTVRRGISPSGQRRECTYYTATGKGRRVLMAWRALQREMEA